MIRFSDATILAYTKLRTHKVRTGLTTGIAGILFGLILAVIMVATGVFTSVDKFSKEGLGDRTILSVYSYDSGSFDLYQSLTDESFVAEVERAHKDYIVHKAQVSKKYNIPYTAATEDPSPVVLNKETGKKYISDESMSNQFVQAVMNRREAARTDSFDIEKFLKPYKSAKVLTGNYDLATLDGASFQHMKDGKESSESAGKETMNMMMSPSSDVQSLNVMNQSITEPFILTKDFDYSKGEVPVIISFGQAEKMLGYKVLAKDATNEQKMARMQEVRTNIGKATTSFCYRNQASQQLLAEATEQVADMAKNSKNKDYIAPLVQYALPASDSCGAVTITKDIRTAAEKKQEETLKQYQKDLGIYIGDPVQHKVTVRGVGVASDLSLEGGMSSTVGQMVTSLLGSWLGYGHYMVAPADMVAKLPESARPSYLFPENGVQSGQMSRSYIGRQYMVEFIDKEEARKVLNDAGGLFGMSGDVSVSPFGSSSLIVDEIKVWFERILWWTIAVVGGIALIILAGLIGRMVSDGRRESAIFRAIGARRSDIGGIYGVYTLLLSARVAVFAFVLGAVLALLVEIFFKDDATLGARLAYAASDTTKEFHLFGLGSWYIVIVLAAIIVVGLLASIIPILLGARRNPIKDMRDDS